MTDDTPCPDGYERVPGNPYILVKTMAPCADRTTRVIDKVCCGRTELMHCARLDVPTTRMQCLECADNGGPPAGLVAAATAPASAP